MARESKFVKYALDFFMWCGIITGVGAIARLAWLLFWTGWALTDRVVFWWVHLFTG